MIRRWFLTISVSLAVIAVRESFRMFAGGGSTVVERPRPRMRGSCHGGTPRAAHGRADHRRRRQPSRVGAGDHRLEADRTGLKVLHDMGDHVRPGEPLVELDAVDAKLAYNQAQSKYLAELVKLGISEQQAQRFIEQYGISEELIRGAQAEQAIDRVPAVIQIRVSKEKALHNLNRQRP